MLSHSPLMCTCSVSWLKVSSVRNLLFWRKSASSCLICFIFHSFIPDLWSNASKCVYMVRFCTWLLMCLSVSPLWTSLSQEPFLTFPDWHGLSLSLPHVWAPETRSCHRFHNSVHISSCLHSFFLDTLPPAFLIDSLMWLHTYSSNFLVKSAWN